MGNDMNSEYYIYHVKESFLTKVEQTYMDAIKPLIPEGYYLQPQVSLASIINKTKIDGNPFQNELYRNIDFCVLSTSHKPVFLIEINDSSHIKKERIDRDKKVQEICEEAGIPLVRLWTSYGIKPDYIQKRVLEAIDAAKNPVRVAHSCANQKTRQPKTAPAKSGCYIATCVYGSYECPQVQILRKYRDEKLLKTTTGKVFVKTYYAASPTLVKMFGRYGWFKKPWKIVLDMAVQRLSKQNK